MKCRRYLFISELYLRQFVTGLRSYVTTDGILIVIGLTGLYLMYSLLVAVRKQNVLTEIYIWACNGGMV